MFFISRGIDFFKTGAQYQVIIKIREIRGQTNYFSLPGRKKNKSPAPVIFLIVLLLFILIIPVGLDGIIPRDAGVEFLFRVLPRVLSRHPGLETEFMRDYAAEMLPKIKKLIGAS